MFRASEQREAKQDSGPQEERRAVEPNAGHDLAEVLVPGYDRVPMKRRAIFPAITRRVLEMQP